MSKISVKTVVGRIKIPSAAVKIMQVAGIANKWETGMSYSGEYISLLGQFQATNTETGIATYGDECVLPLEAVNMVLPVFNKKTAVGVEFVFDILIKPAENIFGYEYLCDAIVPASENNPLDAVTKKAQTKQKKAS